MPIALAVIGIVLVISGARGQAGNLGKQVAYDFSHGFLDWVYVILGIGFLGYIPGFDKAAKGLLVLVLLVYLIGNRQDIPEAAQVAEHPPASDPELNVEVPQSSGSSSGGSSAGGILGDIGGAASAISSIFDFF